MTPEVARAIEAIRATAQRGMTVTEPPREPSRPAPRRHYARVSVAARLRDELLRSRGEWVWAADLARRLGVEVNGIIPSIRPWVGKGVVETRQGDRDHVSGKIKRLYRIPLAALALTVAGHGGAQAEQMPCAKLAELTAGLAEHYREKLVSAGLQANGQLLEIFASPDGSTWTALTTSPAGLACVVATGKSWQQGAAGEPS
jgi:hypothetical protein